MMDDRPSEDCHEGRIHERFIFQETMKQSSELSVNMHVYIPRLVIIYAGS